MRNNTKKFWIFPKWKTIAIEMFKDGAFNMSREDFVSYKKSTLVVRKYAEIYGKSEGALQMQVAHLWCTWRQESWVNNEQPSWGLNDEMVEALFCAFREFFKR